MGFIFFKAEFNEKNKPTYIQYFVNDKSNRLSLFEKGTGTKIIDVYNRIDKLKDIVNNLEGKQFKIGINDFRLFRFLNITNIDNTYLFENDVIGLKEIDFNQYRNLLAKGSYVYASINDNGMIVDYRTKHPKFDYLTFTGRSRCSGFNIQGLADKVPVYRSPENNVLLMFDWIAADIRVASYLSNDSVLQNSFIESDPYQYLADQSVIIGTNNTRDECKLMLLKAINSLDPNNPIIEACFPDLNNWVRLVGRKLNVPDFEFRTILGRIYKLTEDRNKFSIINAILQGSVAHCMQNVIYNISKIVPGYFICDIHDSIVISIPDNSGIELEIIKDISNIMYKPLQCIVKKEVTFPLRILKGKKWKAWSLIKTVKSSEDI